MKIGEKDLSFPQKRKFGRQRLLHFDDHVRAGPNILGQVDDFRAGLFVILIGITGTDTGVFFHEQSVSALGQLLHRRGEKRDALFLFLNFLGNADNHLKK